MIFKHGAKEIAWGLGYGLTFMAKPDHAWTGSSGHLHMSAWGSDDDRRCSTEGAEPYGMSDTMRWFLGGRWRSRRELAIFFAPSINSYKRFASASWAPVNVVWGRDNRTTGFRVVGHGPVMHIECRFPGGDMNAYLTYAAFIGAGLYGVRNQVNRPPRCVATDTSPRVATACHAPCTRRSGRWRRARSPSRSWARMWSTTTSTQRASSSRRSTRWSIPGSASATWNAPEQGGRRASSMTPTIDLTDSTRDSMRLADKVCVITGAGSGMGRVAATIFAAEGARVVVADTNETAAGETVAAVTNAGGGLIGVGDDHPGALRREDRRRDTPYRCPRR